MAGGTARVQVVPPLALSQAALVVAVLFWAATSPSARIWLPETATDRRFRAPPGRRGWSRCQLVPVADRKTSGFRPADPTAMKPVSVRLTALIWSPGRSGRPAVEIRVQVWPSGLVQIDEGPSATQAPCPPATNRAAYPGGGGPPPAVRTWPMDQVRPSSADTKNWARAIRAPCCEPT